jgi:hypothetical protein
MLAAAFAFVLALFRAAAAAQERQLLPQPVLLLAELCTGAACQSSGVLGALNMALQLYTCCWSGFCSCVCYACCRGSVVAAAAAGA